MAPRPTEVMVWVLRGLWVTANNLYAIPAMLIWMFLLSPLCLYSPKLFYRIEEVLFSWLHSMVACWTWSAGYQVAESGASLDELKDENLLIMANHQSTADVPVLMTVFSARIGFCNKLMWIMDRVFKFTNFGLVCWMHDDFFILAGKDNRDQTLKDLKQHLQEVFLPKERKYLVLFPEGGFLRKRKEVSHRYAKKLDLPLLEHCTLPRTGALDVIMDIFGPKTSLSTEEAKQESEVGEPDDLAKTGASPDVPLAREDGGHLPKIVDVTVAYPEGRPLDLQSIVTGWRPPCTTHVHYRVFNARDLPRTSDELFSWMVKLYQEKEEMLDKFYKTGKFPHDHFDPSARPPRILTFDPLRFLVVHIFFIFSNYLFYCLALNVGLLGLIGLV